MDYKRMPIEMESPEQIGYSNVKYNLAESSVRDVNLDLNQLPLQNLLLCYGDHLGKPELRELIAGETKSISKDQILLTPSAATALFIISTSLLSSKDHLIVVRPNYATNIETPRAIGCEIDFADVHFEDGFRIDWNQLKSLIKSNTKLISLTHPHNPTGKCLSNDDFKQIKEIAGQHNIHILVDETYRELHRGELLPYAADLHSKIVSVCSLSKAFGLPGIRIGWILCQDDTLMLRFLAAKEQIIICNSVVDEEIGYQFYKNKNNFLPAISSNTDQNFELLKKWFGQQEYLEWIEPQGGVVCFPRIKSNLKIDYNKFYADLNTKFETFVGPGHWFEMPKNYMRLGFGYPLKDELSTGLINIEKALDIQLGY
jgi:aspartate/methionine/tyrosine aminotransferase